MISTPVEDNIINGEGEEGMVCEIDNVKTFCCVLKAINFSPMASISITEEGLRFSTNDSKSLYANAYLPCQIFKYYKNSQNYLFVINLNILLNCLNEFAASRDESMVSPITLKYSIASDKFCIEIKEFDVITKCSIGIRHTEEEFNEFNSDEIINKFIILSECMKEMFLDLDTLGASILLMFINSDSIKFSCDGPNGTSFTELYSSSKAVEFWQCTQQLEYRYKIQLLKPSIKALSISKKVSIRIDHKGFLSIQHLVCEDDIYPFFFDFICAPHVDI